MTEQTPTGDGEQMLKLDALVSARMREGGWSLSELERRAKGRLSKSRWQQLASGSRMTTFPEPPTLLLIADVLEVDVTAVVLAAACSLGLPVRSRGPDLAQLLPAGTDRLSSRMRESILAIIRAAVSESLKADGPDHDLALDWPKQPPPTQKWVGNGGATPNERHG